MATTTSAAIAKMKAMCCASVKCLFESYSASVAIGALEFLVNTNTL
jgi:hypothetical protein